MKNKCTKKRSPKETMCKLVDDHKYKPKGKFTLVCNGCGKETVNEKAISQLIAIMEARIASLESELHSKRKPYFPPLPDIDKQPAPYKPSDPFDKWSGGGWGGSGGGIGGGGGFTTTEYGTDGSINVGYSDGTSQTFSPANIKRGAKISRKELASIQKAKR